MLFNSDFYIIEYGTGKNYFEIVTFLNFKQGTLRARITLDSSRSIDRKAGTSKIIFSGPYSWLSPTSFSVKFSVGHSGSFKGGLTYIYN